MGAEDNGTSITRRELAAELRAARAEDRNETVRAITTAVAPVVDHIQKLESGEFTPAFKAGILTAVDEQRGQSAAFRQVVTDILDKKASNNWLLRSNKLTAVSVLGVLAF